MQMTPSSSYASSSVQLFPAPVVVTAWQNVMLSAVAPAMAVVFTNPFDTAKVSSFSSPSQTFHAPSQSE